MFCVFNLYQYWAVCAAVYTRVPSPSAGSEVVFLQLALGIRTEHFLEYVSKTSWLRRSSGSEDVRVGKKTCR